MTVGSLKTVLAALGVGLLACQADQVSGELPDAPDAAVDAGARDTATAQIPATGGTIAIDGFELTIPPGSLLQATVITISKIDEVAPAELGVGTSNTYRIEPADLTLLAPIVARVQLVRLITGPTIWVHAGDEYLPAESTYDSGHATAEILQLGSIFVGKGPPALVLSPSHVHLGNVNMAAPVEFVATVTNTGGSTVTDAYCRLGGLHAEQFEIRASTCFRIDAGAVCYWYVRPIATVIGPLTATLTCGGTQAIAGTLAITMTSQPSLEAALSPKALDFGEVIVGQESELLALTFQNAGTVPLGLPSVDLNANSMTPEGVFTIERNECAEPIAAGSSCSIFVRARPSAEGEQRAALVAEADPGGLVRLFARVQGRRP